MMTKDIATMANRLREGRVFGKFLESDLPYLRAWIKCDLREIQGSDAYRVYLGLPQNLKDELEERLIPIIE